MKILRIGFVLLILALILYFLGPHPGRPVFDARLPLVKDTGEVLDIWVRLKESKYKIKDNNQSRIVWVNDSLKNKTPYSVVYLHGFSASQEEGNPVHRDFARKFGCNLYLSRLADHGLDTSEPLLGFTAEKYWNSAKEALAIGKQIGDRVIIVGTSTGGTLALMLAAQNPDIAGLILLSPNISINDPNAWLLNNPWGLQIARAVVGGKYIVSEDKRAVYRQYWSSPYRIEAAVQLEEMLESIVNKELFQKVRQPVLMLYYYKDEANQDPVVKVSAMREMFGELGTPAGQKREMPIPGAGDHVIGSHLKSKDIPSVEREMEKFARDVLHLRPVAQ